MAKRKIVAISVSDNDPEVQALFNQWYAAELNVSRLVVAALRKVYIEPEGVRVLDEIEQKVDTILDILKGGRQR